MKTAAAALFGLGGLLLLTGLLLSLWGSIATLPSYLADWLFWSSLPVGALPVVMLLDLADLPTEFGLQPPLRRLLLLMPAAGLLMIPILLRPHALFGWAAGHGFSTPFGQAWMTQGGVIARSIVYFVIWSVLALLFAAPPAPAGIPRRRNLAAFGLFVYLLSATLAATDWAMTTAPDWFSAEFGLLVIAAQITVAVSVAVLLAGAAWRQANTEAVTSILLITAGGWAFLQFVQYLVIWSGDKPSEITWYLQRGNPGGMAAVWIGFVGGLVVPFVLLHSPRLRQWPLILPGMAVLILCVQALGMLWLITPSLRHSFTVSGMDILELAGIGGVMAGLALWPLARWPTPRPIPERRTAEVAHG